MRVGQKVVCINAKSANSNYYDNTDAPGTVKQDSIYKIDSIRNDDVGEWISLEEVPNTEFQSFDFRPLDYEFVEKLLTSLKEETVNL